MIDVLHVAVLKKPVENTVVNNVAEKGSGVLNIDDCRVDYENESDKQSATPQGRCTSKNSGSLGAEPDAARDESRREFSRPERVGRFPCNVILDESDIIDCLFPESEGMSGGGSRRKQSSIMPSIQVNKSKENRHLYRGDSGSASRYFKKC